MDQVGLVFPGFMWVILSSMSLSISMFTDQLAITGLLLAQDVQVDWGGFTHGKQDLLNVLNVQSLLWFSLPAAQHDIINLFRTDPWPLQHPTLGYALNNLQRRQSSGVRQVLLTD